MSGVTAVVVGGRPDCARAVARGQVAALVEVPSLAELRDAASAAGTGLLWLLDSAAVPAPDTLPALLDAGVEPAASLPVDAAGAPLEGLIGRFAEHDVAALLEAARRRRVRLRRTHPVSLLVARDTVLVQPPPDPARFGAYAGTEWTERVFGGRDAILVPASRVRVAAGASSGSPLHALRAARACGWALGETLRELQRSVA